MKLKRKTTAGVSFDPDVLKFLNRLAGESELSRSIVINKIIKEYAKEKSDVESITQRIHEPAD